MCVAAILIYTVSASLCIHDVFMDIVCFVFQHSTPVCVDGSGNPCMYKNECVCYSFNGIFQVTCCTTCIGVSKRISTFNHSIASFEATHVTSTSIKLTWSKSTQNFSVGYYLSYFRDDFAVSVPPTYMRLLGRDVTTVDVTDLQPGIKYNFSLWAFTEEYNNSRLRQVMKAPINATATTSESGMLTSMYAVCD